MNSCHLETQKKYEVIHSILKSVPDEKEFFHEIFLKEFSIFFFCRHFSMPLLEETVQWFLKTHDE